MPCVRHGDLCAPPRGEQSVWGWDGDPLAWGAASSPNGCELGLARSREQSASCIPLLTCRQAWDPEQFHRGQHKNPFFLAKSFTAFFSCCPCPSVWSYGSWDRCRNAKESINLYVVGATPQGAGLWSRFLGPFILCEAVSGNWSGCNTLWVFWGVESPAALSTVYEWRVPDSYCWQQPDTQVSKAEMK